MPDKINLNNASIGELEKIPGIGRECAQTIVKERDKRGGFDSISELEQIGGFGDEAIRHLHENAEV